MKELTAHLYNNGEDIHITFEPTEDEIEIYVAGCFLCSVDTKDISEEAYWELFGKEKYNTKPLLKEYKI